MKVLDSIDNENFFTATEVQRATGMDRKRVSSIGKSLGLGEYKFLEEAVESSRLYYSVDDVMKIGRFKESMRKIIRRNLWTKSRSNSPIRESVLQHEDDNYTIGNDAIDMVLRNEDELYDSDRLQQLRNSMGDIAYTNIKTKKGLLTTNELESMFQLDSMMVGRLETEYGLIRHSDGVDHLYYFSDLMKSIIHMIDDVDHDGGDELLPKIPVVENTILQDINKVSSFFHDEVYREKILERFKKPNRTKSPIWRMNENKQFFRK